MRILRATAMMTLFLLVIHVSQGGTLPENMPGAERISLLARSQQVFEAAPGEPQIAQAVASSGPRILNGGNARIAHKAIAPGVEDPS